MALPSLSAGSRFAIVGAGRVGVSTGILLQNAGHKIVGCAARSSASLERAVRYLGCPSSTDAAEIVGDADCVIIATPDDAVVAVAEDLAGAGLRTGTIAYHTAGSMGVAPLRPLQETGVRTLAVHVLQSIPDIDLGVERIPGSWFGVTCDDDLKDWAGGLVSELGGRPIWIAEEARALYHAAAVIASNYLVALAVLVRTTGQSVEPYLPLMEGTLANIEALGVADALTGPVVRGDVGTLRRHVEALAGTPEVASAYRVLAGVALRSALEGGKLSPDAGEEVRKALE